MDALVWKWQIGSPSCQSGLTALVNQKNSHPLIKQLLKSVIARYHDFSESHWSIIFLSLWLWQTIDLLVADKSQYFVQPCSMVILVIICMKIWRFFQNEELQTKAHLERKTNSYSNRLCLFFPSFILYSIFVVFLQLRFSLSCEHDPLWITIYFYIVFPNFMFDNI